MLKSWWQLSRRNGFSSAKGAAVRVVGNRNKVLLGQRAPILRLTAHVGGPVQTGLDRLSPYSRLTPLVGREREMQALHRWLEDPTPILARVMTGAAGRGKTRLALEACEWAERHGWTAGVAAASEMARFLEHRQLSAWEWQRPTLVVIDDAAQFAPRLAPWMEALAFQTLQPVKRLRLLLLERHASLSAGWCRQVFSSGSDGGASSRVLLNPPEPVELAPLQSDESRLQLMSHAARASDRSAQAPDLSLSMLQQLRGHESGGDPLYLMLLAGSGERSPLQPGTRADLALKRAVGEATRTRDRAYIMGMDPELVLHLAACVTLAQGMEPASLKAFASQETRAVGREGGGNPEVLAELLGKMYVGPGGIAPIRPDLIGEAVVLGHDPDMKGAAVLRCYAQHGMAVVRTLVRCVEDFSPQRPEPLQWLMAVVGAMGQDEAALSATADILPQDSAELADINLRVAQGLLALQGAVSPADRRAGTLERLAMAYWRVGAHEEALQAAHASAALYRELAKERPEAFRPELARSLTTLARHLGERGQRETALQAAEEAAQLYRELVKQRPDVFRLDLARALATLTTRQGELGRREEALAAARESAALYRELTREHPDVFRSELARSLNNLGNRLSELGQRESALRADEESALLYRDLAKERPDVFRRHLAVSLTNLAGSLSDAGQSEAALHADEEAVCLYRELADGSEAFQPDLATSLNNLANRLTEVGQRDHALAAAQEAASLYRRLAHAFRPDLARSLNNLAIRLSDLGQRDAALAAAQEAADIRRELAGEQPQLFRPDLAGSLNTLANRLSDLGHREQALLAAQESAALYRALAEERPDLYRRDLAMALHNLANRLSEPGQGEAALEAAQESVALYRELVAQRSDLFGPDLAKSLTTLANRLSDLGEAQRAVQAAHESVARYRELVKRRPEVFRPDMARCLSNLAAHLSDVGQREAALDVAQEAAGLYRELAQQRPDIFRRDLAMSLNSLADRLSDLGQWEQALQAAQESAGLYRQLAKELPDVFRRDLALSLYNLALRFKAADAHERALSTAQEAADLHRLLAGRWPKLYRADLNDALALVSRCQDRGTKSA